MVWETEWEGARGWQDALGSCVSVFLWLLALRGNHGSLRLTLQQLKVDDVAVDILENPGSVMLRLKASKTDPSG